MPMTGTPRELNLEPTDFVIRGLGEMLRLLHRYGRKNGVPAKALAKALWPHSTGWTNEKGLSLGLKGRGPTYAAANLLVRMERMSLVEKTDSGCYTLTGDGLLQAIEKSKETK